MLLIILLLLINENLSSQSPTIACEGNALNLLCPVSNTTIKIDYANYGRSRTFVCSKAGFDTVTNCSSKNATLILIDRCEHRQFCELSASNDIFGDTCANTYKYLEVNFTCI